MSWSATNLPACSFNLSEHSAEDAVDEATPAAASNGKNALIVWKDNRADKQPYHQGRYLLYGRRFDLKGQRLDAGSFQIEEEDFVWNNEGLTLPTVGILGRDYLVVWLTRFRQVSARRVHSNGTLATNEIQIATTGHAAGQPAFASTRHGGVVVWTDRINNNGDIYATLLDKHGAVTRIVPVAVDSANAQYPTVASAGKNYLVLWRELSRTGNGVLKGAVVTDEGEVRPLDQLPSTPADWIALASNGRNYFATWQIGSSAPAGNDLMGCTVNCHGEIVQNNLPLNTGAEQSTPIVLSHRRAFTILWRENPYSIDAKLYTLPLSSAGQPKCEPAAIASEMGWSGYGSATALNHSKSLVVLEQKTADYLDNGYISRVRGSIVTNTR